MLIWHPLLLAFSKHLSLKPLKCRLFYTFHRSKRRWIAGLIWFVSSFLSSISQWSYVIIGNCYNCSGCLNFLKVFLLMLEFKLIRYIPTNYRILVWLINGKSCLPYILGSFWIPFTWSRISSRCYSFGYLSWAYRNPIGQ